MTDNRNRWRDANRKGTLTIKGTQSGYGASDVSEVTTSANYVVKEGKRYLFYREYLEGGASQQVRMTIEEKEVILKKVGPLQSTLHFIKGKSMPCHYMSPVGPMELVSKTRAIKMKEGEHSFFLKLEYSLYMHEQHMSDYNLEIRWEEKEE